MKTIDMRFNLDLIKNLIGKCFIKYKCDAFKFTNSVTGTVGIYIDDLVYELRNEQESVDYFGVTDDYAVFNMITSTDNNIKSFFFDTEQINTPIKERISKITVINENQKLYKNSIQTYDVWLTRGIIFHLKEREVCFEKDTVPFSEEIIIRKGYKLIDTFEPNDDFCNDWDEEEGYLGKCSREIIEIK